MPVETTETNTAGQWAALFLNAINAPVTQNNVNNVVAWGIAESGQPGNDRGHGGWTNFNPLNVVTQAGDKHVGEGGTQGNIADFANAGDGVAASARLFTNNRNAAPIIDALRADAPRSTLSAAINRFYSSWGGSISLPGTNDGADEQIGTNTGGTTGAGPDTTADNDCVLGLPGVNLGPLDLGGNCLINRSRGRALLGATCLAGGLFIMLAGVVLVMAGTKTGQRIVSAVPGIK